MMTSVLIGFSHVLLLEIKMKNGRVEIFMAEMILSDVAMAA